MRSRHPLPGEMDSVFLMGFDAWGGGLTEEIYLEFCRRSPKYATGEWLILERSGAPAAGILVHRFSADVAGLGSLATRPELRRQGLAACLVDQALALLDREGARKVYLYADIAPRYYERFGFKALPPWRQMRHGSTCMLRSNVESDALDEPPPYF